MDAVSAAPSKGGSPRPAGSGGKESSVRGRAGTGTAGLPPAPAAARLTAPAPTAVAPPWTGLPATDACGRGCDGRLSGGRPRTPGVVPEFAGSASVAGAAGLTGAREAAADAPAGGCGAVASAFCAGKGRGGAAGSMRNPCGPEAGGVLPAEADADAAPPADLTTGAAADGAAGAAVTAGEAWGVTAWADCGAGGVAAADSDCSDWGGRMGTTR